MLPFFPIVSESRFQIHPTWSDVDALLPLSEHFGWIINNNENPPTNSTAIIIPYRNREAHLKHFLVFMHKYLRWQANERNFVIIVVNQTTDNDQKFNRAKLMNVGVAEIQRFVSINSKDQHLWNSIDCYIFHDVDSFPVHTAKYFHFN